MSDYEGDLPERLAHFNRDQADKAAKSGVFSRLTPEERAIRLNAARARLQEMELEAILRDNVLPADLPQPDTYGPLSDDPVIYFPEGWDQ